MHFISFYGTIDSLNAWLQIVTKTTGKQIDSPVLVQGRWSFATTLTTRQRNKLGKVWEQWNEKISFSDK